MRHLLDTIGGLWQLFLLAARSRFRLTGRYWAWRRETAFGRSNPRSRRETLHAVLEYGRWIHRMKRLP